MSEFNLLAEPWIRVRDEHQHTEEVSLSDVLLHANQYADLNGETQEQDFAILRLLLGLLYSVISRSDPEADDPAFESEEEAESLWESIWKEGSFPSDLLERYFARYWNRFWLFDEKYPFYQSVAAAMGTQNSAAKLNGTISESNHKVRMFSGSSGSAKNKMTYAQAARWLIYLNAFDDTSAKPSAEGKKKYGKMPSPGAGWLGQLGLICVTGRNLFETLMLNLQMLDDNGNLWDETSVEEGHCACWELSVPHSGERTEIPQPHHFAQLMTLQSRRILLNREEDRVVGYGLLGGDFFQKAGAVSEPMTLWRVREEKGTVELMPRRHNPDRQIWREFSSIAEYNDSYHRPGVVSWVNRLIHDHILPRKEAIIHLKVAAVVYGDKDFFVNDTYEDTLTFHAAILDELDISWRVMIENVITICDECAKAVRFLTVQLKKAAGDSGDGVDGSKQMQRFYARIDPLFRDWLAELDPDRDEVEARQEQMFERLREMALRFGTELVREAGPAAMQGRVLQEKGKDQVVREQLYWAPKAIRDYDSRIYKLCLGGS